MIQSTLFRSWRKSYNLTIGDIWDVHRLTETWHVEKNDGNALKPNDVATILFETGAGAPVIPDIGDPYFYPTGGLGTTMLESMLVRSHQWSQPGGKGIDVTINYETRYFETNVAKGMSGNNIAAATTLTRGLFLPAQTLPIFMSRNIRLYRDNPGMTSPSMTLDKSSSDIGGDAKEIDQDVKQIGLKVRLVVDSNSLPMVGNTNAGGLIKGMVEVAYACLGYKNSAVFLNNPIGTLVCTGANINHLESEFFEFALEFLYDQYFHHSQMPEKASDGRIDMLNNKAKTVYWTRPVRGAVDFNDIWPAGDVGQSQRYQCHAGRWY